MSRPETDAARLIAGCAAALVLSGWLAGCSDADMYLDRRDSITLGAGDAIAANKVEQMIDPWPSSSGNRNIAFNGQKMQTAVERYRNDKVTPPADPENFISNNQATPTVTQNTYNGAPPAVTTAPGQ